MTDDDPFRCICPHVRNPQAPIKLIDGIPRAVEGCPAHAFRYAFQQKAAELWPDESPLQETYPGSGIYE